MRALSPMAELEWSQDLEHAAFDHLCDIGPKGLLSHQGSNKSSYRDRIEKHCQWGGTIFEAIDYGLHSSAKEVVISWLIDDGVPKRLHRNNILSGDNRYCAVACGPHALT